MKQSLLVIITLLLSIFVAYAWFLNRSDFSPGECVKAQDGFIWKVSRIEDGKYILQGWFDGWGNEAASEFSIIRKDNGHFKIECPFYTMKRQPVPTPQ
jgi:hypothetical protein